MEKNINANAEQVIVCRTSRPNGKKRRNEKKINTVDLKPRLGLVVPLVRLCSPTSRAAPPDPRRDVVADA